jgi:hypothetical protein
MSSESGLPDGIFSYQKSHKWACFGGHWNGKCPYISWSFEYFTAIWFILWPFIYCIFVAIWDILWSFGMLFSGFGVLSQEKSGNPGRNIHESV